MNVGVAYRIHSHIVMLQKMKCVDRKTRATFKKILEFSITGQYLVFHLFENSVEY